MQTIRSAYQASGHAPLTNSSMNHLNHANFVTQAAQMVVSDQVQITANVMISNVRHVLILPLMLNVDLVDS